MSKVSKIKPTRSWKNWPSYKQINLDLNKAGGLKFPSTLLGSRRVKNIKTSVLLIYEVITVVILPVQIKAFEIWSYDCCHLTCTNWDILACTSSCVTAWPWAWSTIFLYNAFGSWSRLYSPQTRSITWPAAPNTIY